jgi:hypothetical protein
VSILNATSSQTRKALVTFLSLVLLISGSFASGAATAKIRVALFIDRGANPRPQVFDILARDPSIFACTVRGEDIRRGCLKNFDVVFMPGGSGKKEAFSLEPEGRYQVCQFVKGGGIYIGVCAGCYLASTARSQYLGLLPATTVDKEHWRRGKARLPVEFTNLGMEIFGIDRATVNILYHNGPVLRTLSGYADNVIPLSYFRDEVVAPGGVPGLMKNAPAMVLGQYGNGLVLGISPHPEATPGLGALEIHAIHWLYNRRSQNESPKSTETHSSDIAMKTFSSYKTSIINSSAIAERIFNAAEQIFEHATSSRYEHLHEGVTEQVRIYNGQCQVGADCSGFVSYVLDTVSPKHYAAIASMTQRSYPHAKTYAKFFSGLRVDMPTDGWLRISDFKNLRCGDLIAWARTRPIVSKRRHDGSGHVMIVVKQPDKTETKNFHGRLIKYAEVCVLDSSSVEHFPPQSLPPLLHQQYRNGIGKGMIRLMLDNDDRVIGFWEGSFSHERGTAILGPSYTEDIGFARPM